MLEVSMVIDMATGMVYGSLEDARKDTGREEDDRYEDD